VREGTSGGESCRDGPGMMCFEGGLPDSGTTYVEPVRERLKCHDPRGASDLIFLRGRDWKAP